MKTRPERDPKQMAQFVYSIPCERGRSYFGETGRSLSRAYEEGHGVRWGEARILKTGSNSRYRKHKQSAHMACLTNPTNHPSLGIPPVWIPLISNEVTSLQRSG
jgi:hypothetical protein